MAKKMHFLGAKGLLCGPALSGAGHRGVLVDCDNAMVVNEGVYEPRWPFEKLLTTPSVSSPRMLTEDTINGNVVVAGRSAGLQKYDGISFTDLDVEHRYHSYAEFDDTPYLLADIGLRRIDADNTTAEPGYIPEGLDMDASLDSAGGWLASNSTVAYRYLFGEKRGEKILLGAPSGRMVFSNTASATTYDVSVDMGLPVWALTGSIASGSTSLSIATTSQAALSHLSVGMYVVSTASLASGTRATALSSSAITLSASSTAAATNATFYVTPLGPNHFLQLYRTPVLSGSSNDPGDDMRLNYEAFVSQADIQTGTVTVVDQIPDGGGGAALYTNASQRGILQANYPCECRADIELTKLGNMAKFARCLWATNYQPRGALDLYMLAVGSPNGVQSGDTITIAGTTYTATGTESASAAKFKVFTSGSTADNIKSTSESLVRVINRHGSNFVTWAHYLSGPEDLPGHIRIVNRADYENGYTVSASRSSSWAPDLSSAVNIPTVQRRNRLAWSRIDEPHSWPVLNWVDIPAQVVFGLSSLRNALVVWTSDGIYRITGVYGNFALELLDADYTESSDFAASTEESTGYVVVNNVAYGKGLRGYYAVTESGTRVISSAIKQRAGHGENDSVLAGAYYIGVDRTSDGMLVFNGAGGGNTILSDTLLYNPQLDVWTAVGAQSSVSILSILSTNFDDKTYFLEVNNYVMATRRSTFAHEQTLMYDDTHTFIIDSISGNVLTVSGLKDEIQVGDAISQGGNVATILERTETPDTITVADGTAFSTGAATAYQGFDMILEYAPSSLPDPATTYQVRYADVLFDAIPTSEDGGKNTVADADIRMYVQLWLANDFDDSPSTAQTAFVSPQNFGHTARFILPSNMGRGRVFSPKVSVRVCYNYPRVLGVVLEYETLSGRTRR